MVRANIYTHTHTHTHTHVLECDVAQEEDGGMEGDQGGVGHVGEALCVCVYVCVYVNNK